MLRRAFRLAPLGRNVGIFAARSAQSEIVAVVLPKLWAHQEPRATRRFVFPSEGKPLLIVGHELEVIEVEASDSLSLDLLELPVDGKPSALIAPTSAATTTRERTFPSEAQARGCALGGLRTLDDLLSRLDLGSLVSTETDAFEHMSSMAVLRPLLLRRFVGEVEQHILRVQRDYRWTQEGLALIRGRPLPESVALATASGQPMIICRFEEFTFQNELLEVLSSALEVAAAELRSRQHADIRQGAIRCRRLLGEVQAPARALALATSLRLQRGGRHSHEAPWPALLRLAEMVLNPIGGTVPAGSKRAREIVFDTSLVWERIVHSALRRAGLEVTDGNQGGAVAGISRSRPWQGLGGNPLRPDLIVRVRDSTVLLDAKYKRLVDSPGSDDEYQLFAYSHLVRSDKAPVELVGLAFTTEPKTPSRVSGPHARGADKSVSLMVGAIPFPDSDETGPAGWATYLESLSPALRQLSGHHVLRQGPPGTDPQSVRRIEYSTLLGSRERKSSLL